MLLRKQMEIIAAHQNEAPVQTVPIASALGVTTFRVPEWPNNVYGMIRRDEERGGDSGYAIYVNASHPEVRRRFTIAHEIAHYVLHESLIGDGIVEDALLRANGLTNKVEAEANRFAAGILMPWPLVERLQSEGIVTIEQLADRLVVSRDAMSIRLLGLSFQRHKE